MCYTVIRSDVRFSSVFGGIAQLVRALASHARGRRFESYCLYHQDTHERSVKTLPCVSFSLSFIRFKGFLYPFFFFCKTAVAFSKLVILPKNCPTIERKGIFITFARKVAYARRHKKIIAPLHS